MSKNQNCCSLSKVFGGPITPSTEGYSSYFSEELDLLVSYAIVPCDELADYTALSTSLCDAGFHENVISPGDLKIITHAYRKTGLFNNRLKSQDNGHSTFLGPKTEGSQSNPPHQLRGRACASVVICIGHFKIHYLCRRR